MVFKPKAPVLPVVPKPEVEAVVVPKPKGLLAWALFPNKEVPAAVFVPKALFVVFALLPKPALPPNREFPVGCVGCAVFPKRPVP